MIVKLQSSPLPPPPTPLSIFFALNGKFPVVPKLRITINFFLIFLAYESDNSASNRELMERVKQEVFHHVGGQDHFQWSNAQIEGT